MGESNTDRIAEKLCDGTLPRAEWTHHAHLRAGLWHLLRFPVPEALDRLRDGIKAYNLASGVANTENSGYHETITRFYVWAIDTYLRTADRNLSTDQLAEGLIDIYGDKGLPFRYYSRERLMSTEARLAWIEPDLAPLD